jgi:hypothetical protein
MLPKVLDRNRVKQLYDETFTEALKQQDTIYDFHCRFARAVAEEVERQYEPETASLKGENKTLRQVLKVNANCIRNNLDELKELEEQITMLRKALIYIQGITRSYADVFIGGIYVGHHEKLVHDVHNIATKALEAHGQPEPEDTEVYPGTLRDW